jgi:uncharacterized YigZ family protein
MKRNLIIKNGNAVLLVKKSSFHALTFSIKTESDFSMSLRSIKQNYKNATHYCYAYRIVDSSHRIFERMSDDGEPHGTAGLPLLSLLQTHDIANGTIVVVRFYGGVKLGKKGLFSAYLEAGKCSLSNSEIEEYIPKETFSVAVQYPAYDAFERVCQNFSTKYSQIEYGEDIQIILEISSSEREQFLAAISQANLVKHVIIHSIRR